jgi:transcriptional regulator with XRE-family HTH domain
MRTRRQTQPHPLQVFGNEVRRYRELSRLSQEQLGDKIPVSGSHIGKIERGETRCDRKLTVRMNEILDTRGALPSLWDELVKDAIFPSWFDWPEVEANPETVSLDSYECLVVYGLLQTEKYASVLMNGDTKKVEGRMSRQELLTREDPPPPRVSVILTESVLTNMVGSAEIMREQLNHLLSISSPRISIQVVTPPLPPTGTDGAFCLATFADRTELAYVETAARGITLSEKADIWALSENLAAIRSMALPVNQSRDHIRRVMEERWT